MHKTLFCLLVRAALTEADARWNFYNLFVDLINWDVSVAAHKVTKNSLTLPSFISISKSSLCLSFNYCDRQKKNGLLNLWLRSK